jgi:hypothetical protein
VLKATHILILLATSTNLFAQPDIDLIRGVKPTVQDTTESRLSFGLGFTPEINNILTSSPVGTEGVAPRAGITFGINFGFSLSKSFRIRTGFYYGRKGYTHIHDGLIFPQDTMDGNNTTSRLESQLKYSVFHLPLILQFNPGGSRFFATAGLAWDHQHSDNADRTIYYGSGDTDSLTAIQGPSPNFSAEATLGYKLAVSRSFELLIEPIFKFHFREYLISGSNLYNLGLRVTLNYNI